MSIRLRLTLTYSAVLFIILVIFGVTVASVLHWALLDSVDHTLDQTAIEVVQNIQGPYIQVSNTGERLLNYVLPPGLDIFRASNVFIQVWNSRGVLNSSSNNLENFKSPLDAQALTANEQTRRDVTISGTPLRVLTRPINASGSQNIQGRIQIAVSLQTLEEAQSRVTTVMLIAGVFAMITSFFLGSSLIGRALRPVEKIADAASHIATGDDLSRRIDYDGPQDELGMLTMIFNDTLDRLENLFMAQRRFVADVSHELRTPLTVVRGNIDLMRRYGADEDSLAAIANESNRMTRLVGDLLLLAQADAGELPLIPQDLELDTMVLEVFEQAALLMENGATIKLGRFEPARVNADPDRLKQLLLNLISNALKHTPQEGSITLSVWPERSEALVSISDTGEGIPTEDLPHIFDRFYRVDKARARRHGGAGLGLSIARWIAEAHGGHLHVESTVGEGTTFTVYLPRKINDINLLPETNGATRKARSTLATKDVSR